MKPISSFHALVFCLLALACVGGCTLIGYAIGSGLESREPERIPVSAWQAAAVTPGEDILLVLRNGAGVPGVFEGTGLLPDSVYSRLFNRWAAEAGNSQNAIRPGDTVLLRYLKNSPSADTAAPLTEELVVLRAYDLDVIWLQRIGDERARPYEIASIGELRRDTMCLTGPFIRGMVRRSGMPVRTEICLNEQGIQHWRFNIGEVRTVEIRKANGGGAIAGAIVGAIIDIGVIVALTNSGPSTSSTTPTGGHSCPLAYSFDGTKYVLESETFSGSVLQSLARTDYDGLDHVAVDQGMYRVKLTNELPETDYVDELHLLCVDHPEDVRVLPEFDGTLHTLRAPQPPRVAYDYSGCNVLPAVSSADGDLWMSNPFNRDPETQQRDGVSLVFARPAGSRQMKLALRVQNTAWAVEAEQRLYDLAGSGYGEWAGRINFSASARASFVESVKREAMLSVNMWNGREWTSAGTVWFVGPLVAREVVLPIDCSGIEGDEVRLTLESTAGLWMIDEVRADFSEDVSVRVSEVAPASATTRDGTDVRALLESADGRYHVLDRIGMSTMVEFAVPPQAPGTVRTVILKSAGYYLPHALPSGPPQLTTMHRIGDEHGAFGTFTLGILNNFVDQEVRALRASRATPVSNATEK